MSSRIWVKQARKRADRAVSIAVAALLVAVVAMVRACI